MDATELLQWRKEVVTAMLTGGYCIERIIPDVMTAEKFINTGKYPEEWKDTNNQQEPKASGSGIKSSTT